MLLFFNIFVVVHIFLFVHFRFRCGQWRISANATLETTIVVFVVVVVDDDVVVIFVVVLSQKPSIKVWSKSNQ